MNRKDRNSVVFTMFSQMRASFNRHNNLMKKTDAGQAFPSFQFFLYSLDDNFMREEIINMYAQQYIREISKSEIKYDKEIAEELRKMLRGEQSEYSGNYNNEDLKICIEAIASEIHHNIGIKREAEKVKEIANQKAQEWEQAIALNDVMEKWTRTPDVDFIPDDIVDGPILGPK